MIGAPGSSGEGVWTLEGSADGRVYDDLRDHRYRRRRTPRPAPGLHTVRRGLHQTFHRLRQGGPRLQSAADRGSDFRYQRYTEIGTRRSTCCDDGNAARVIL